GLGAPVQLLMGKPDQGFGRSSKFGLRFALPFFNLPPPATKTPTIQLGIGSVPPTSPPSPAKTPSLSSSY
ncbi:hypothetical protein, partial [Candidatus Litorirhabdus singularis]|uniref:hypothetical protein n=1 Tax=Candidatus Litorirhabdus singularis TaxID=2518993 RepID=UPI00242CCA37